MSLAKLNYTLSNVNAILGSTVSYVNDKQDGDKSGAAEVNLGLNIVNGLTRNAIAEDMRRHTGSYMGYVVNNLAGYGNATSNIQGTVGLMGASMLTNPFLYRSMYCAPTIFNSYSLCQPMYTGGMYGSMFGGGCCDGFSCWC